MPRSNGPSQKCPICFEDIPLNKIIEHVKGHSKGGNKYHAKRVECDGYVFDSKMEKDHYLQLKAMEQTGAIRDLELQPKFPCIVNGILVTTYTADFKYFDVERDREIVEDVKGKRTEAFVIRKKLTQALYGIVVYEIKM